MSLPQLGCWVTRVCQAGLLFVSQKRYNISSYSWKYKQFPGQPSCRGPYWDHIYPLSLLYWEQDVEGTRVKKLWQFDGISELADVLYSIIHRNNCTCSKTCLRTNIWKVAFKVLHHHSENSHICMTQILCRTYNCTELSLIYHKRG